MARYVRVWDDEAKAHVDVPLPEDGGEGFDPAAILARLGLVEAAIAAGGVGVTPPEWQAQASIPWTQGKGTVPISYEDSKVVSQAARFIFPRCNLAWVSHLVVLSSRCASSLPEPNPAGDEWEWKLPWMTKARGYWRAPAEIWNAGKTHHLDGLVHLRTTTEGGIGVVYASIRIPQPDVQKSGAINKRAPWKEPWGNGFIYAFTAIYPCD